MTPLEFFNSICGTLMKDLLGAVAVIRTKKGAEVFYLGYVEHLKITNDPERAVEIARTNLAWAIKELLPPALYDIWNDGVPKQ